MFAAGVISVRGECNKCLRGNTWNKQPATDQSDYSISLKYGIIQCIHVCTVVRKSLYVELVIQPTTQGLKPKDEKLTEEELENDIPENCARSLYKAYTLLKYTHSNRQSR